MTARNAAAIPILAWARDEMGCEAVRTRSHWKVTYQGRFVGTVPSTPSDSHSLLNARTLIRRNINKIRES